MPGETTESAIRRRVQEELGIKIQDLRKISDYRYRFEFLGIVENEICPIYRGVIVGAENIQPNPLEVEDYRWLTWSDLLVQLASDSADLWSPWCKEEVKLINHSIITPSSL
jgi:isopentenyl-diphosphate delta-isomerase